VLPRSAVLLGTVLLAGPAQAAAQPPAHLTGVAVAARQDTVRISVQAAFDSALAAAPEVAVARLRADAAQARAQQAARLPNPQFAVEAENLGRERVTTGLDAPDGIEGQAVLSPPLPFGPTRSGTVGVARAEGAAARALATRTTREAAEGILGALGELTRARIVAENARQELSTLEELARALALQADEGRASASDAARTVLAQGLAATALARREGDLARAVGEVARRLGMDPEAWVELEIPPCSANNPSPLTPGPLPELAFLPPSHRARSRSWPSLRPSAMPPRPR
jgi:outer membrane protein TolC